MLQKTLQPLLVAPGVLGQEPGENRLQQRHRASDAKLNRLVSTVLADWLGLDPLSYPDTAAPEVVGDQSAPLGLDVRFPNYMAATGGDNGALGFGMRYNRVKEPVVRDIYDRMFTAAGLR